MTLAEMKAKMANDWLREAGEDIGTVEVSESATPSPAAPMWEKCVVDVETHDGVSMLTMECGHTCSTGRTTSLRDPIPCLTCDAINGMAE